MISRNDTFSLLKLMTFEQQSQIISSQSQCNKVKRKKCVGFWAKGKRKMPHLFPLLLLIHPFIHLLKKYLLCACYVLVVYSHLYLIWTEITDYIPLLLKDVFSNWVRQKFHLAEESWISFLANSMQGNFYLIFTGPIHLLH